MSVRIDGFGGDLRPLESVPTVGRVVFGVSKSTAYRMAARDSWPQTPSRQVIVIPLLDRLGLTYNLRNTAVPPLDSPQGHETGALALSELPSKGAGA